MDKVALKARLVELTRADYENAREKYVAAVAGARTQRGEPLESDAQSRAEAAGEIAEAWDDVMHDDEARVARLDAIDFSQKDTVTEGAAVRFSDRVLVICVATPEFEFDGAPTMGISPAAPIYREMAGLSAGDEFTINGTTRKILGVY